MTTLVVAIAGLKTIAATGTGIGAAKLAVGGAVITSAVIGTTAIAVKYDNADDLIDDILGKKHKEDVEERIECKQCDCSKNDDGHVVYCDTHSQEVIDKLEKILEKLKTDRCLA